MHIFELTGTWMGGISATGDFQTQSIESRFSVPKAFGGEGSGTNPEDLILSAASSCFQMTLGIALGYRKVGFSFIRLRSVTELETDGRNFRLTKIKHMPVVFLESGELYDTLMLLPRPKGTVSWHARLGVT